MRIEYMMSQVCDVGRVERLTATLFTHAEMPVQPPVEVEVGDAVVVVVVGDAVVVVGDGAPETGHVFPRTVSIHDEVASGYYARQIQRSFWAQEM